MKKTIPEAFGELLMRLEPKDREVSARASHRRAIEQALAAEFAGYKSLQIIGSHTRDTAIHILSDIDYFAMLGIADVSHLGARTRSTTTLDRLKRTLDARFSRTNVRVSGPAVIVEFGQGSGAVDVVPGVWVGTVGDSGAIERSGYPLYEIPDGNGGWFCTSPQRHSKYLRDEDARSGYKLSRTTKLLKCWKYARFPYVPLLAFHLELLLASEEVCLGPRSYQCALLDAFRLLRDRKGRALNDPLGISGRIEAVQSKVQAATLTNCATYAAEHAARAIDAERCGDIDEAFRQWNIVFNGEFSGRY